MLSALYLSADLEFSSTMGDENRTSPASKIIGSTPSFLSSVK